jgi:hypothetical protein
MDRDGFQRWLDGYVSAWKSYDRDEIRALFSDDAVYRNSPDPDGGAVQGCDAIADAWLSGKDAPGSYEAKYEPLAIDGDLCVANGTTTYFNADGSQRDEYYNVYACRFNDAGECASFTEYGMQKNEYRKAAREELVRRAKAGEI